MEKQVPPIFQDKNLLKEINKFGYQIEPYAYAYADKKLSKDEIEKGLDKTGFCIVFQTDSKEQVSVLRYDCFQDFMSDDLFGYADAAAYAVWNIRGAIAQYKMAQLKQ